ncbi:hypothetical protein [Streptomyces sp. enrichment culture]|uniref:hypothetical protein n=1 Tax=Streptomyces sp. enrichment culture TaxID=1795815 RepID=UPI003F55C6D8
MPAPTHPRPHPVTTGGTGTRLPWWALALPTLAFLALFALLLTPSEAHATTGPGPAVAHLLERAHDLLTPGG